MSSKAFGPPHACSAITHERLLAMAYHALAIPSPKIPTLDVLWRKKKLGWRIFMHLMCNTMNFM